MRSRQHLLQIFLLLIGYSVIPAVAQNGDCTCLPIFPDSIPARNIDSIIIDTCGLGAESCIDAAGRQAELARTDRYYAKMGYIIRFGVAAIHLPAAPADSIMEVTWQAIDTAFWGLRNSMEALGIKYGSYVLQKREPTDSNSQEFALRMSSYTRVDSVVNDLLAIEHVSVYRIPTIGFLLSVYDEPISSDNLVIYPQPARNYVIVKSRQPIWTIDLYDLLGREATLPTMDGVGSNVARLNVHELSSGVWYLRVNDAVQSLIIQR